MRSRVDGDVPGLLDDLAADRVEAHELLDLVAPELDADRGVLRGRPDLDRVAAHAELAARRLEVVARVLDGDEPAQHLVALDRLPRLQQDDVLEVLLGRAQAVDAADTGDDDDVAPQEERRRRGMTQPVDLVVDGRVLLDVEVLGRDVGLGLVVVVVAHEVLDGVVGQELAELVAELRRQGLVVRDDESRLLHPLDDVGHRERLARARDAQQRLVLVAAPDALGERRDRLGLVAGEAVVRPDGELRHDVIVATRTYVRNGSPAASTRRAARTPSAAARAGVSARRWRRRRPPR